MHGADRIDSLIRSLRISINDTLLAASYAWRTCCTEDRRGMLFPSMPVEPMPPLCDMIASRSLFEVPWGVTWIERNCADDPAPSPLIPSCIDGIPDDTACSLEEWNAKVDALLNDVAAFHAEIHSGDGDA